MPNNRRQRRTCYALCHILYPVSAAHTSIFRMDSNSTSYPFLVFFVLSPHRSRLSCPFLPRILSVFPILLLLPPGEGCSALERGASYRLSRLSIYSYRSHRPNHYSHRACRPQHFFLAFPAPFSSRAPPPRLFGASAPKNPKKDRVPSLVIKRIPRV